MPLSACSRVSTCWASHHFAFELTLSASAAVWSCRRISPCRYTVITLLWSLPDELVCVHMPSQCVTAKTLWVSGLSDCFHLNTGSLHKGSSKGKKRASWGALSMAKGGAVQDGQDERFVPNGRSRSEDGLPRATLEDEDDQTAEPAVEGSRVLPHHCCQDFPKYAKSPCVCDIGHVFLASL